MKSGISAKSMVVFSLILLLLYLGGFYGLEHWRHRKGPWEVTFASDSMGNPAIVVYQPRLEVSALEIVFLGENLSQSNFSQRVFFDRPLQPVPFGKVIYEDLTFLPGVVTFDFFGHEVELLPRTLIINKKEIPWKSDSIVELPLEAKPATPPKASPQKRDGPSK